MSVTKLRPAIADASPNPGPPGVSSNGRGLSVERDLDLVAEIRVLLREEIEARDLDVADAAEAVVRKLIRMKRLDLLVQAAREGALAFAWDYLKHNPINDKQRRSRSGGSSKWDAVRADEQERPDIFLVRVQTESGRKRLGECSKADLVFAAASREKQATTMLDNAERLKLLARKLKAGQVVGDLERSVVEGIFDA